MPVSPLHKVTHLELSDSSRGLFNTGCERKFEFRKLIEFRRNEDSFAGNAGTAMHAGYQSYLTNGNRELAQWEMMKRFPIQDNPSCMQSRSLEACYWTLEALMDYEGLASYRLARIQVGDEPEPRPAVEVPFRITLTDIYLDAARTIPISYIGYMDAIMYDAFTNSYIVVDLKTTTVQINGGDYSPLYKFADQCLPYAMVLAAIQGHPITELDLRYLVSFIDHHEPRILSYPFPKTQIDIEEWGRSLLIDIMNLRMFYDMGWFPRRGNQCYSWSRVCPYFDYCDVRDENFLRQAFDTYHEETDRPPFEPWFELSLSLEAPHGQ